MPPTDNAAPLSVDELATIQTALARLNHANRGYDEWDILGVGFMVKVDDVAAEVAVVLNALPRLLASAERETALRAFVQRVQREACDNPYCGGGCLAQAAGDILEAQ